MSARWPAISARRRRRISSSLFPLNIGPQTTSSQPPPFGCVLITIGEANGWGGRSRATVVDDGLERATADAERQRLVPPEGANRAGALPGDAPARASQARDVPGDHCFRVGARGERPVAGAELRARAAAGSRLRRGRAGVGGKLREQRGVGGRVRGIRLRLLVTASRERKREEQQPYAPDSGAPHLSSRDMRRSLSTRPSVWHVGQ